MRWQTAVLLNSWSNGSKVIQPTDLLKLDDETDVNEIQEITPEALEIFKEMDEIMNNKFADK